MEEAKTTDVPQQNAQKVFCKQPISCPWITAQPYPSTANKNKAGDPSLGKFLPSIPLSMESRTTNEKTCPSLQHSSSQFFYFLRLMQLFPETHPATLHTVLNLCKNDFFCAVDKLLYAKRCKALYSRGQSMFKRCATNRSHPYCGTHGTTSKNAAQLERGKRGDGETTPRGMANQDRDVSKVQIVVEKDMEIEEDQANNENPPPAPTVPKLPESDEVHSSNVAPSSTLQETLKFAKDLSQDSSQDLSRHDR